MLAYLLAVTLKCRRIVMLTLWLWGLPLGIPETQKLAESVSFVTAFSNGTKLEVKRSMA